MCCKRIFALSFILLLIFSLSSCGKGLFVDEQTGVDKTIELSPGVKVAPVENDEQAVAIAKEYVYKKFNNTFSDYKINCVLKDGIWIVSYTPNLPEGEVILGGGGPQVKIEQASGEVIFCLRMK